MLAMSVEGAGAAKQVEAIKTEGKSVHKHLHPQQPEVTPVNELGFW
jgi:hypothetical protein